VIGLGLPNQRKKERNETRLKYAKLPDHDVVLHKIDQRPEFLARGKFQIFRSPSQICVSIFFTKWLLIMSSHWTVYRGGRPTKKNYKKSGPGFMAETPRAGTGDFACRIWLYRCSMMLNRLGNLAWVALFWSARSLPLIIVDNCPNMHNTDFFPICYFLSVTDGSIWIPYLARYSEIFKKPNFQVEVRGKRSPGATARHRSRTRVPTNLQSSFWVWFLLFL